MDKALYELALFFAASLLRQLQVISGIRGLHRGCIQGLRPFGVQRLGL